MLWGRGKIVYKATAYTRSCVFDELMVMFL